MTQTSWIHLTFELVLASALALTVLAGLVAAWRSRTSGRDLRRLAVVELVWSSFPLAFLLALAAFVVAGGHA